MPRRPAIVVVEPVRARVVRGPRADGSWYWRSEIYQGEKGGSRTIATFWAQRAEVAALLHAQIAEHGLDKPAPEEPAAVLTVQDLLETWLGSRKDAKDLSENTKRASKASAGRLTGPEGGRTALSVVLLEHLDRRHLEQYRDTAGGGESTIARDLKTLRSAWKWGRDVGHVPNRSLPSLRRAGKPKAPKPVYTRFTPTEAQVAAVIERLRRPWVRRAVTLLSVTGARIGEVASLRWGAVAPYDPALPMSTGPLAECTEPPPDLQATDAASVVLDGKTGPREVQLHPSVAAEVLSWRPEGAAPEDGVWGVSTSLAITRVQLELAEASEALKLPRLSPNGLRRYAERALYRTREIEIAASIMGHSAETALKHYRDVTGDERGRVVRDAGLGLPQADPAGKVVEGPWKPKS